MSDSVQDFSAREEVARLRTQLFEANARADSWRATAATYRHWHNMRVVLAQALMLALIGLAGVAILAMAIKGA